MPNPKAKSGSRFDSPAFLALRDVWYAKLKSTGFDDVESGFDLPDTLMKRGWINTARQAQSGEERGGAEWYRLCAGELSLARFETRGARFVWVQYCEGWNIPEIVQRGLFAYLEKDVRRWVTRGKNSVRGAVRQAGEA